MPNRPDGRAADALRAPIIDVGFQRVAEGSVLYRAGGTVVLCTASVDAKVPPFLEGKGRGWVTAEYQMHPRANPMREGREGRGSKSVSGRTHEIQRLIGRALRSAVHLERLVAAESSTSGPRERQIVVDCDVLEADGGTRTASITGGFVALVLALAKLAKTGVITQPVLRVPVAAISAGHVDDGVLLDLAYVEDSRARVDLNLVATERGDIVEVQGTAEGVPLPRVELDAMIDLGLRGIATLCRAQRAALSGAGVDVDALTVRG